MKKTFGIVAILFVFVLATKNSYGQKIKKQVNELLTEVYVDDLPGAVVLISEKGKTIYKKAFGMADIEFDIPMNTDMVFQIGSVTKQFTAVSILMLMEQGKLSLDDDIIKYIEDFPANGNTITIHHLLTHTSGIKDVTDMEDWNSIKYNDYELKDLINVFKNEPINFKPGESHQYCNSAYILLGYIIEKVSGQAYQNFIEENIFQALKMSNSYYGNKDKKIKNRVTAYQKEDDKVVKSKLWSMSIAYAAGALMSNAEDLNKWNQALKNNKLISSKSLQKAYTNFTLNNGEKIGYGYGWFVEDMLGSPNIWHGGHIAGFISWEMYFPEEDAYVVILSNCSYNFSLELPEKIASIVLGKPINQDPEIVKIEHEILKQYIGVYQYDDTTSRYIKLIEDQLYYQKTLTGLVRELHASSENNFFMKGAGISLEFTKDDKGSINGFMWNSNTENKFATKTNDILPEHSIKLSREDLENYVGTFKRKSELFDFELRGNHLIMRFAADTIFYEIFPDSKDVFIVGSMKLVFSEDKDTMTIYKEGREFITQRIK